VPRRARTVVVLISVVLALVAVGAGFYRFGPRHTPDGQPPLASLESSGLDRLKASFNAHPESARVIALLSPT
jgi:hypothetical protein